MTYNSNKVPFVEKDVKEYLDRCIANWREKLKTEENRPGGNPEMAECYIDAFQSVRVSLFGELKE